MIFGDVPVAEAEGLILAHSVRLPGGAFKKGRVLSAEDIQALLAAKIETVSGARLEPDDVGEDEAAQAVARAVAGPGLTLGDAFTGRCNIFAEGHGLAVIDDARVDRLNLLDEAMTLGTVAPHALVEAGQMVATVKVIPFAASRPVVDRCVEIAADGGPMLGLAPLKARTVGLIQTRLPGTRESVLDSTTGAVATRLAQLDGALAAEVRCAHSRAEVAEAVGQLHGRGCDIILIAGASAIVDRRDVVPAAVVEAGGAIDHFGMPGGPRQPAPPRPPRRDAGARAPRLRPLAQAQRLRLGAAAHLRGRRGHRLRHHAHGGRAACSWRSRAGPCPATAPRPGAPRARTRRWPPRPRPASRRWCSRPGSPGAWARSTSS